MLKLTYLFGLFFLFLISGLQAQTSINTSGGNIISATGSISYSVGQIFYDTRVSEDGSAFPGVQQAIEIYRLSNENIDDVQILISTYPNPTKDILNINIQAENITDYHLVIYSIDGRKVQTRDINNKMTQLDLNRLPASAYILNVFNKAERVGTFKIIKK